MDENIPLRCAACEEVCLGTRLFNRHLNRHVPPYSCGQGNCNRNFQHKTSLIRHIKDNHLEVETSDSSAAASSEADSESTQSSDNDNAYHNVNQPEISDDSSESEDEGPIDLESAAAEVLLNLRSSGALTTSVIERFQDACSTLIGKVTRKHIQSVKTYLRLEDRLNTDAAQDLLRDLATENPFVNIRSLKQQLNYFSREMGLVLPVPHFIGTRVDFRLHGTTGQYEPCTIPMTFEYVPIIETLKLVLSNPRLKYLIENEKPSDDGILRSYLDGTRAKSNNLIQEKELVLRIQLYLDDLEVVNPLGSRTSIHKLTAMYFNIQNLPPVEASQLATIFLLGLAYTEDIKPGEGYDTLLYPFLQDLEKLESPDGVRVTINGEILTLRATLCILAADTAAAHEVLGYLSPSARHFCRRCMVSRPEFLLNCKARGELRTREQFDQHVEQVKNQVITSTECGVKKSCPLHSALFFSAPIDSPFDIFHDILEGSAHLVILVSLRYFIKVKDFFSLKTFNDRLTSFNYGVPENGNKPSVNFTESRLEGTHFLQKGSQTWCLMRMITFLCPEVPDDDPYLKLINLLQQIMLVVFSLEIRHDDILKLEILIDQFLDIYQQLHIGIIERVEREEEDRAEEERVDDPDEPNANVPDRLTAGAIHQVVRAVSPINKLHHLTHVPEMIREMGPPVRYWCIRYEAKHHFFCKYGSVCCNFINLPKSMAQMHQICTLSGVLDKSYRADHMEIYSCVYNTVTNCEHSGLLVAAGLRAEDVVSDVTAVIIVSDHFRPGLFVVLDPSVPSFGVIDRVYSHEERNIYFIVSPWKTQGFEKRYCAYHVTPLADQEPVVVFHKDLRHHKSFAPWNPFNQTTIYISSRTMLF
ncbi:Zinc finger protein Eos [Frankliniella fusca]|uniref:Zinc finger protein Eos n=1 Tax=Frankliniella fusca TaxID=407009 RepID=A0AAE1HQD0_9NEOP|nr:Zinc finger protein Eos [Frankliniella fusca]